MNSNAAKLDQFFGEFPELFEWRRQDGGCVGYPRYKGSEGADTFCEELVSNSWVRLLPPRIYILELLETPDDRFFIGFGRQNMDEGLNVFRTYLKTRKC